MDGSHATSAAHVSGRRIGRRGGTLALVIAGVLAVSTIVAWTVRRAESSPNRRLAEAVGSHRVTRARLTGGFAYVACATVTPNDSLISGLLCERTRPDQWAEARGLSALAAEMRAAKTVDSSDAARRHALGTWHIVWGNVDAAIDELRGVTETAPTSADIQSDLAAAFLARAEREQDPRSILDAYVAADSALALDSLRLEARFNRAVALEWLQLRTDAVAAWAAYLEFDSSSGWADEARARLELLRAPAPTVADVKRALRDAVATSADSVVRAIARRHPARVREETRRGMKEWAAAYTSGSPEASSDVRHALVMARALADVTTDSLWADALSAIANSPDDNREHLHAVARGVLAYEAGSAALGRFDLDSANAAFRASHRVLSAARNALQYWALYGRAEVAYSRQSAAGYTEALSILGKLRSTTPSGYRIVRGMAARTAGVIHGIGANFDAAVASYLEAVETGEGSGEPGLEIRPHANLAGNYANLGQERLAWRHVYAGVQRASQVVGAPRDAQRLFGRAADLSWRQSGSAALLFQREATRLASVTNSTPADSLLMVTALEREAELLGRQGRTGEAFKRVAMARSYIARIAADSVRALYTADVDLVEGQAWLRARPDSAARVLTQVVERYGDTRYLYQVARAQLLLANAHAANGNIAGAQRAFDAALDETERRRAIIGGAEDRARFLDQSRPVIDSILSFRIAHNDTLGAFEFMEGMRARVLLERASGGTSQFGSARTVDVPHRDVPAGTSVVSYALIDGELVAWLVRASDVTMIRTPIPRDFDRRVDRFATALARGADSHEVKQLAADLYRVLVAPLDTLLEPGSRLTFVPDKSLHFVPFAALYDLRSKRFLVERFEIAVAPSVRLFEESLARYRRLSTQTGSSEASVLVVGNPSFDASTFPLPRLPGAEREARAVAGLYEDARLLVGGDATRLAFLRDAPRANVIHFAGHGVVRSDAPLSSYLLFAADTSARTSAMLTAGDLFAADLRRTRLAILSGCHTATGGLSTTEGPSSLARAFFAAGVPAVVASLWAVEDETTAEFFTQYHRALLLGDDPTAALRRTQLAWLARGKDEPRNASTWAAFTMFGATGVVVLTSTR